MTASRRDPDTAWNLRFVVQRLEGALYPDGLATSVMLSVYADRLPTGAHSSRLRVAELLTLKWEDIDLVAGQLIVRRTLWQRQEGPPKGGSNRKVPLSDEAIAVLKAQRHLKGPYVFCDGAGNRLSHSIVKDVVPFACRKAQLSNRSRRTGSAHVREPSRDAWRLRYSHLTPDVKREMVRLLDRSEDLGDIRETESSQEKPLGGPRGWMEREKGI